LQLASFIFTLNLQLVTFKKLHLFINLIFSLEALLKKEVNLIPEGSLSPYLEPYIKKEAEKIEER